jgi:hypothetical protein
MKTQPLLVPKGRTRQQTHSVRERMKHPRLNGADLYVARFGGCSHGTKHQPEKTTMLSTSSTSSVDEAPMAKNESSLSCYFSSVSTSTGSLHDDLVDPNPRSAARKITRPEPNLFDMTTVHASRPCYRCISYMDSVGIKRVFWTKNNGEWEGAKVRDLVDALDGYFGNDGCENEKGVDVFVTKHEVLMMRRMMSA